MFTYIKTYSYVYSSPNIYTLYIYVYIYICLHILKHTHMYTHHQRRVRFFFRLPRNRTICNFYSSEGGPSDYVPPTPNWASTTHAIDRYMHICIMYNIYIRIYSCIHLCVCVCTYVVIYIYIYIHIYILTTHVTYPCSGCREVARSQILLFIYIY